MQGALDNGIGPYARKSQVNGEYAMVRQNSLQHIENCVCGTTNEGLTKQVQEMVAALDKEALKRFETKGRFYQELDNWLQAAKQIYPITYAKDVRPKSVFSCGEWRLSLITDSPDVFFSNECQ